ncbi:MAG TPA: response regulator [Planctomycetota bacterium]|nr:response regulator [Planctomycetota bacterium]
MADPPASHPTILLVEDEEGVRRLMRIILAEDRYEILEAPTGAKALYLVEHEVASIDLLLTDVGLPGMSGPELAHRVSQIRPGIKVLFISGHTGEALVHLGLLDSDRALLQKPFSPDQLRAKVRDVLRVAPMR